MLIIADKKIPDEAKINLKRFGELIEFHTSGITYDVISGHPDIFFCKVNSKLIVTKNLPENFLKIFEQNNFQIHLSKNNVSEKYPFSAILNAVTTEKYLIHNLNITDEEILKSSQTLINIDVHQGYTRCNLLHLKDDKFITSDLGIHKTLVNKGLNAIYVDSKDVILPGFKNGFFGGACGVWQNKIFILGSLKYFKESIKVNEFAEESDFEIIELHNGKLFDGGTILFLE